MMAEVNALEKVRFLIFGLCHSLYPVIAQVMLQEEELFNL